MTGASQGRETSRSAVAVGGGWEGAATLLTHPGTCASSTTVLQSMKLGVDVNRHKEVIVKAISAVLLLLLKHFKLNHVYQVPARPAFPPSYLLHQGLGRCCSSSPEEWRPWPSDTLKLCVNVLRCSLPTKAFVT